MISFKKNDDNKKSIKKIADAKGYPAKKKSLYPGDEGVNAKTIISFNPERIPGHPFYKNG